MPEGKRRRTWREVSPRARRLIIAVAAVDGVLKTAALLDLRRRTADELRGPKRVWVPLLLTNSGSTVPLAYFLFGRRRSRTPQA